MTAGDQPDSWSLQSGIDPDRWPPAVRDATSGLRQGDLVEAPPLVYAASADHPLHAITVAWSSTDKAQTGAVNVTDSTKRAPYGVIVTQTCDLVEEGRPKRPWVHVAPVYRFRCDRGIRTTIERERGFDYLCPVTALEPFEEGLWVADLRLLVAIEKGRLVGVEARRGFRDDQGTERLSRQLARVFSRPAYPTPLIDSLLEPLNRVLREVSEQYGGQDPIIEVGLALGRSRLDPSTAEIVFLLEGSLEEELRNRLLEWGKSVADNAPEGIELLLPRFESLDDLSAREYRQLILIDVSAFSPEDSGA